VEAKIMQIEQHQTHTREHASLLADAEKRALVWMARRMPAWVNADHLTLLGFAAMFLAGVFYWAASRNRLALLGVIVALALNWFGDSLDGTLARVRNHQRPRYGWYVDHVIDIIGTSFLLGGLSLSGYMDPLIAVGLLAAFMMVEAEVFLATHANGVFRLSFMKLSPTELRIVLAVGTLMLFYKPWVRILETGPYRLFDVGGVVSIVGLILVLATSAIRNTRALYRAERIPR
jgi:phosphatidylglycerophosphate synthase